MCSQPIQPIGMATKSSLHARSDRCPAPAGCVGESTRFKFKVLSRKAAAVVTGTRFDFRVVCVTLAAAFWATARRGGKVFHLRPWRRDSPVFWGILSLDSGSQARREAPLVRSAGSRGEGQSRDLGDHGRANWPAVSAQEGRDVLGQSQEGRRRPCQQPVPTHCRPAPVTGNGREGREGAGGQAAGLGRHCQPLDEGHPGHAHCFPGCLEADYRGVRSNLGGPAVCRGEGCA